MIHTLALIVRRPDLDRAAFRHHYETRHAPLALARLPGFRRYVRNHVVASYDATEPDFDVLSEFAYADEAAARRVFAVLESDAGRAIREDERRFMDKPRNVFFAVEPRGSAAGDEPDGDLVKIALLARRPRDRPPDHFLSDHRQALAALTATAEDVATWVAAPAPARPAWDLATFVWFAPARFDPDRVRAFRPPAEAVVRLCVEACASTPAPDPEARR